MNDKRTTHKIGKNNYSLLLFSSFVLFLYPTNKFEETQWIGKKHFFAVKWMNRDSIKAHSANSCYHFFPFWVSSYVKFSLQLNIWVKIQMKPFAMDSKFARRNYWCSNGDVTFEWCIAENEIKQKSFPYFLWFANCLHCRANVYSSK